MMKPPRCGWREAGSRLEDRWYRVSPARRRELLERVREKIAAHLPADHPSVRDFDAITARTIRPSSLVHMARVHGVRGAWRLRDWARAVYRSDAALLEQMLHIRLGLLGVRCGWFLLVAALVLAPVRRWQAFNTQAEASRFDYCPQTFALAVAHMGSTPLAVNAPRCGWARVAWWRVRAAGDPDPPRTFDLFPYAVAAAAVLFVVFPDQPHAGIVTAALSATGVFEVRTGGNAANSGYFNPGGASPGTDRSLSNTPHVTIDGVTITATVHTATTQLNITGYTVSAADNRNGVRITGGTMTAGLYEITAVDVGNNRWTVDRAAGTAGQTGTGRMGGAVSSLGLVGGSVPVARNKIWIAAGTYSITSATDNIDGGTLDPAVALYIEGYQTSRGDLGTPPLLQASGISTFIVMEFDAIGLNANVYNVDFDGDGLTSGRAIEFQNGGGVAYKCSAIDFTNSAFQCSAGNLIYCVASGHTTQTAFALGAGQVTHCIAHTGTTTGFTITTGNSMATAAFSFAYGNSGATSDGFTVEANVKMVMHCVAYDNGRDGFRSSGTGAVTWMNCIAESNDGIGFDVVSAALDKVLIHNAAFDNGTDELTQPDTLIVGATIIGSSTFFTNAAGGDFSLNDTAGGGGDLREAGFNVWPLGLTVSFADIGAWQSGEGGGSPGGSPGDEEAVQMGFAHVGL